MGNDNTNTSNVNTSTDDLRYYEAPMDFYQKKKANVFETNYDSMFEFDEEDLNDFFKSSYNNCKN